MRFRLSVHATEDYKALSPKVRKSAQKQFNFLVRDLRHPSLRAKKYDESADLWQGRIDGSWRFYFLILDEWYLIVSIRKHPK